MKNRNPPFSGIQLRIRLLRKLGYRLWKYSIFLKTRRLIRRIEYESEDRNPFSAPAIILSSFGGPADFLILSHLFNEITFVAPANLPNDPIIRLLQSLNYVLYLDTNKSRYSFFKKLFSILRNFNRPIVISPEAAKKYAEALTVTPDPVTLVRIAIKTNVPIIPVRLLWRDGSEKSKVARKCDVWIGRKLFISPRTPEFKDLFFKRRGFRKFADLPKEDLEELADRIFSKLNITEGELHGSNLSTEMGTRFL